MARQRSAEMALGELLGASPLPMYVIDEQRRVVYCNAACAALVGLNRDQLIGQHCDYQVVSEGTSPVEIAASLCPPPEVFAGSVQAGAISVLHVSGQLIARDGVYLALGEDELHCVGVLVVLLESTRGAPRFREAETEAADLHGRLARLRSELCAAWPVDELVGESPAIRRVQRQVMLASCGDTRVVIYGPSGSGREHVARLVHRQSTLDVPGTLVPLCCPLLDAELLQTTITSLTRQLARHGEERHDDRRPTGPRAATLLLLEVDQLTEEAQGELAGFLALPGFELNTVATSSQSLLQLAAAGTYRPDLAFALSTLTIEMLPLSARREDIPLLSQYFLERWNAAGGRQLSGFTPEAVDALVGCEWPDNIDELSEVVETACQAADGPFVESSDLPHHVHLAHRAAAHGQRRDEPIGLDAFLEEMERELLTRALRRAKANKTKAAKMLGITRARLHRRLDHFGLS